MPALINGALDEAVPGSHQPPGPPAGAQLRQLGRARPAAPLVQADPSLIGQTKEVWLVADDEVDQFVKGYVDRDRPRPTGA